MDKEVSLLLALLRNALFQIPLVFDDWKLTNWDKLYSLIKSHALQTLVAEPIMKLPAGLRPSAQIQNELLQLMALNMVDSARMNNDIAAVFQLLSNQGFAPVLLKGQANAIFYPKPLLRRCGDVDIYIGEKDYDAACRFLIDKVEGTRYKGNNNKHREIMYGKTELEIHKFAEVPVPPQNPEVYNRLVSEYLSSPDFVEINGKQIPVPPAQFNPIYVFYHLFHHFKIRGVGFRQFCDVALILHRFYGKLDLQRLKRDLEDFGLMDDWVLFGPVFVRCLGLPKEEFPFYKEIPDSKIDKLVQLVAHDGNFARTAGFSYKTKSRFLFKLHSLYVHNLRYWRLAQVSFPLAASVYWFILKRGLKAVLSGKD